MRNVLLFLGILMILFINPSCKSLLLKTKGITKPRMETTQTIQRYINSKLTGKGRQLYIAKDSIEIFTLYSMIDGFPSVDFFTTGGELIDYNDHVSCAGKADEFAAQMIRGTDYKINPKYKLHEIASKLHSIDGTEIVSAEGADYFMFVYWAKYFGSLNNNVFDILKTLQNNKRVNVKVILVNLDFQSSWGMKKIPQFKGL
ncbi:MAG: hypothetical protein NTX61_14615 [Bacteroidetes bacterium]|nr:hypothetical protein [Bacteroidota bacterium]